MTELEKLQALITKATENYMAQKAKNDELETKASALDTKYDKLMSDFESVQKQLIDGGGEAKTKAAELTAKMAEIENEISDLRSKASSPVLAINTKEQKEAVQAVVMECVGSFLKTKNQNTDFFDYVKDQSTIRCKALNISSPATGGLAIAETLARDVMDYARDMSPILDLVGRKPGLTRSYRQLIKVTYPSVSEGIEAIAGTVPAETSTQTYTEVKAKEFKLYASPRITNEALYGTDIDVYGDLVTLLGEEIGIYLAFQVLRGDGVDKNCRGILSSNRVNVTNLTGESWKPTLTPTGVGARLPDFYPAYATGVSGSIGTDDKAKVDFVIKAMTRLPKRYRANAKWIMNENTKTIFELVRDSNNNPIFRADYRTGEFVLNGKPVVIDDTWPDIAVDSIFAMYGDLSQAFAINNGDIDQMILDPYTKKGNLIVYTEKEFFEIVQRSDAVVMMCATTNAAA